MGGIWYNDKRITKGSDAESFGAAGMTEGSYYYGFQ